MLNIVIGYDKNEAAAYHTLCHSILTRSSEPVNFIPLHEPTLRARNLYWRTDRGSTDFSFSRFLAPTLARGKVLYLDCDMVCVGDIAELFELCDPYAPLSVCKHEYQPPGDFKFLGNKQKAYPKKLWSAAMMFNTGHFGLKQLTANYVNTASPSDLHQLAWLDENLVSGFPEEWHFIPGHSDDRVKNPKLIHYTEGSPHIHDYRQAAWCGPWWGEYLKATEVDVK